MSILSLTSTLTGDKSKDMIASHNSWTFRHPVKWWMRLFNFMGKCQSKNIQDQLISEVALFDLRLRFHDGVPHVHHGFIDYGVFDKIELDQIYRYNCGVRIVLESNSRMKDQKEQEQLFSKYCDELSHKFKGLKLYGGFRKYDEKKITSTKLPDPILIHKYSSTTSLFDSDNKFLRIIDDWFPRLYAILMNKSNLEKYEDVIEDRYRYFMYDFV